jgi:hypothetical protein
MAAGGTDGATGETDPPHSGVPIMIPRTRAQLGLGGTRIGSIPVGLASGRIGIFVGTLSGHFHLDICDALAL